MKLSTIWDRTSKIDGWFTIENVEHYFNILSSLSIGAIVVEVGVFKGRSTSVPIQMIPYRGFRVTAIDTFEGGTKEELLGNIRDIGTSNVAVIQSTSVEAAPMFLDEGVDLILIDADHYRSGVELDVQAWTPKLKPGGWFLFHDYNAVNFPDVVAVVDEYCGTWEGSCVDTLFAKRKPN